MRMERKFNYGVFLWKNVSHEIRSFPVVTRSSFPSQQKLTPQHALGQRNGWISVRHLTRDCWRVRAGPRELEVRKSWQEGKQEGRVPPSSSLSTFFWPRPSGMVVGSPNPTLLWAIGNYFSTFFPQSWTIDPRTPPPSLMCRTNPLAQLTTGVRTVSVYTNPNWWTPVPSTAEEDSSETSRTAWPRGTLSSNSWVALQERLSSFPEPHAQLCNNNGTVPQPNPPRPGRGHLCRFNGKCGFGGRQCAQSPLGFAWIQSSTLSAQIQSSTPTTLQAPILIFFIHFFSIKGSKAWWILPTMVGKILASVVVTLLSKKAFPQVVVPPFCAANTLKAARTK